MTYFMSGRMAVAGGLTVLFVSLGNPMVMAADFPAALPAKILQKVQRGIASWHVGTGDQTASGVRWQTEDLMAAHRSLPLGSRVRVTNVQNGRSTIVRITDRGPYARGRVIDLSRAAAREIGMLGSGVGQVRIESVSADTVVAETASKPSA